jgi:ankyrin repeat protein
MQELVKRGAKIDPRIGGEHLISAMLKERKSLISVLVNAGADISIPSQSWTPLRYATQMSDIDLLKTLLTSNCRTNLDETFSTLVSAMSCFKMKEAELLFEFITKRSNEEVSDHSSEKNLQLHEKLLGFEDKKGSTLLHYAAAGGSELLYNELIKAGCNPNTKNKVNHVSRCPHKIKMCLSLPI